MKVLLGDVKSELQQDMAMAQDVALLRSDVGGLAADVSSLQAGMDEQQQNAAKLASEVAALKGLLEQLVAGLPRS